MATTPHPLVWDFYRAVDGVTNLGGVVHYFDEYSQTLYLDNGLVTKVAEVPEGHWETAEQEAEVQITNPSDANSEFGTWSQLRLDHPSNGVLYGAACDGKNITFLRYIYAMDLSDFADSWSYLTQVDNAISQYEATLQNIGPDIFMTDRGLFHPGAKIRVSVRMGDSNPIKICTVWLDETDYDIQSKTMTISGRNAVGYYLKDQTADIDFEGEYDASEAIKLIFYYAGIKKYNVGSSFGTFSFDVKASDTLMSVVQKVVDYFASAARKVQFVDLPDGTLCVGYEDWIATYVARGYYTFDVGADVFKRTTTKAIDGAYTAVRVTGVDVDDNDLEPVTVEVKAFPYWFLGKHRTKHLTAPDGMTQEGMQAWAEAQAEVFQYVGIGESFSSPFRPQLLVGDIASIVEDDVATNLGIITEVKQTFSRRNGYATEFSVDSGGVTTDGENYSIYSHAAELNGFNRRQRIIDLVRYTYDKANKVDSLRAKDVRADSKGTASNLMKGHEADTTSHADIREQIGVTPFFNFAEMGLPDVVPGSPTVTVAVDTTKIREYLSKGPIKTEFTVNGTNIQVILYPMYLPASDTYQACFMGQYNGSFIRAFFVITKNEISAWITTE